LKELTLILADFSSLCQYHIAFSRIPDHAIYKLVLKDPNKKTIHRKKWLQKANQLFQCLT